MRIADKMSFAQLNQNLSKNRSEMADLQNQAATLKRVTKPSDDPLAATRVLGLRTDISANEQFLKTSRQAQSFLDYSDQSLGDFSDILIRAKELVLSQAGDTGASAETRKLVAGEVDQLLQQSIQVGNRRLGDRYLFGGYKTTTAPFDHKGNYKGDDGEVLMAINKDSYVAVNLPGSKVFLGKKNLDHEIGNRKIVEPRNIEDIKLAQEHHKVLTSPESTEEEKMNVRGPASVAREEKDTSRDKIIEAKGLSGGLSAAELKGKNVFALLNDIVISMKTNDKSGLQDATNDLDDALAQVVLARAELGARINTLEANAESLRKVNIDSKGAASILEDADQFEVISDINKTEGTLKATLQTSGKLVQSSLLDFLR